MTLATSSNPAQPREIWLSLAPYAVPPAAAAFGILAAFGDMKAKSAMQLGHPAPRTTCTTLLQGVKGGFGAAPTVSFLVGTQMILHDRVQQALVKLFPHLFAGDSNQAKASLTLVSSAVIGVLSSPFLAVYNGKTMMPPWSVKKSLSRFSLKQATAIGLQESGFVLGLAGGDLMSVPIKQILGNNKIVEYIGAAAAGVFGSLVGHAGNTALTRWQNEMPVENFRQLSWGSLRRARGTAVFAVFYKCARELLNSTVEPQL